MIFFVGAMSSNPSDAPYGLWSLVGITAFGALIAGNFLDIVHVECSLHFINAIFFCLLHCSVCKTKASEAGDRCKEKNMINILHASK